MLYLFWAAAVFLLIIIVLRGIADERNRKAELRERLTGGYGQRCKRVIPPEELETISHYHLNSLEHYDGGQVIDEITWNDLDMDKVYQSMAFTLSQTGDEYLYDMLRKPLRDQKLLEERERVIAYFGDHPEERLAFQFCFARMGRMRNVSVSDYLKSLDRVEEEGNLLHYFCILLAVVSVVVLFVNPPAGFAFFFLNLIFSVATYFRRKGQIDPYIVSFAYMIRVMHAGKELLKIRSEGVSDYQKQLSEALFRLKVVERNFFLLTTGRQMTGSILELPLDYLRIFLHLDLIKFNNMLQVVRNDGEAIDRMFECIGFLDAAIAIDMYRASLPGWCTAEQTEDGTVSIEAKSLYHPLLSDPVPSDVVTSRGILVTGSNASGKSTFLKAVALSALFAQTIATVAAGSYRAPFFLIYSSMSLRDDILTGESYYMAEIRSLKRILDRASEADGKQPMICFIDEVLRGTNTIERIAASSQILKSLAGDGVLLFAATHDIELTFMLEEHFDNCHFSEEFKENDIRFSYQLEQGRAESRNAIRLLTLMGYEERITGEAQKTAEEFLRDGKWKKV